MKGIQIAASLYFLLYLFTCLLDFIVWLNFNEVLTSILSFISIIIKFPKDRIDLLLTYTELGNYLLIACGILFLKSLYDLFCGDGLTW
ncbi:MAG: hypothetical protein PHQ64_03725 [Bacilli bacterium]|nr:hypothetical protein [Bacilli bacterium]